MKHAVPTKADYIIHGFELFFLSGWATQEPTVRPKTAEEHAPREGRLPDLLPIDIYENPMEGDGPGILELKSW